VLLLAGVMISLNVAQQFEQRSYLSGHPWTNPATSAEVQIPPGWIESSQINEQGQPIHMFTYPRENLLVVFGREDLSRGMTGAAYAQAFPFAVKNAMALGTTVEAGLMSGRNSWSTSGNMVSDPERRVSVTIVQRDNQMWRTVAVRFNNMPPETESYRILRERLFASIK
jgi:hypothetical protein